MANIGSKQKGGAYPISEEWATFLWRLWKPFDTSKGARSLILDPFANEASALVQGARTLNLEPYGVELQDQFIPGARENMAKLYRERNMPDVSLTRLLHDDSFEVEMSNGGFGIVYCNSPFDELLITDGNNHRIDQYDSSGRWNRDSGKQRYELTSLQHFTKYVAPSGYMVWVAYSQHMTRKVAQHFMNKYDGLLVFRFPEPHLDNYTQIVVIANYIKGHEKIKDPEQRKAKEDWFVDLGQHPEKITNIEVMYNALEKSGKYLFPNHIKDVDFPAIPKLNIYQGRVHFVGDRIDDDARLKMNRLHGAHTLDKFAKLCQPTKDRPLEQPLHRPNKRQLVINIASGMLDNLKLMRNGKTALLRGSTRELFQLISKEVEEIVREDETIERTTETTMILPSQHITLLYEDGEIEDLSNASDLAEIIEENSDLLIETFAARFKPFYDMQIDPVWAKLLKQLKMLGKHSLFKPQKYVICCSIEHMAIKGKQITNAQQGFGKTGITAASAIGLRILNEALLVFDAGVVGLEIPTPPLAKQFGITNKELVALVDNMCNRYVVERKDISGLRINEPMMVAVPAIAPSVWLEQELPPMFKGFKTAQLFSPTDADKFMTEATQNQNSSEIYVGVISYENAKANEGRDPVAVAKYKRGFHNERAEYGSIIRKMDVVKAPTDPITGQVITDSKGEEVPWKYFTNEGRRTQPIDFYVGREFYGYATKVVELPDGKKEVQTDFTKERWTRVVARPLDKDEMDRNVAAGYPVIATRYYPLFSEVRKFGIPKIGNGWTDTPMKEVHHPAKTIKQIKFHDDNGYKLHQPRIVEVQVKAWTILVPDYSKQKNLIPEEPIMDPWLATKGVRYTQAAGKKTVIDRAFQKARVKHYRIGGGKPVLDALLKKHGLTQYTVGVGEKSAKNPRYPLANYLRRFWNGKIGLFVADEIHTAKNNTSEVASAFRDLAMASKKVNGLTGTLYGGKSSSVYALAYAFDEEIRENYPWVRGTPMKWVEDMGVRKMVEVRDSGSSSAIRSGKRQAPRITEANGAAPLLQRVLAKYTLWASLLDLRGRMPEKHEISYEVEFSKEMATLYNGVFAILRDYNGKRVVLGDRSFLAPYYTNMLYLSDAMHRRWEVIHNIKMDKGAARKKAAEPIPYLVCEIPALGDKIRPKEEMAMEWLKKDLAAGRRVIIAMCQTSSRDIRDRWMEIIKAQVPEAKAFMLKDTVKASERNNYIKKMVAEGYNVMITNGGLIQVAISITNFSAWYSIEYTSSLYNFAQSTARINRPSQESDSIVYRHFYYGDDKFQRDAIENIADKVKAAAVLAGAEGGDLAAMMSSEDRVQSYDGLLKAIESGQQKRKSAAEIASNFAAANFTSANWSDSAWFIPGDENEDEDDAAFYEEVDVIADEPEDEEGDLLEEMVI